jgi:tetratricopeptide (TPR) repeat protein
VKFGLLTKEIARSDTVRGMMKIFAIAGILMAFSFAWSQSDNALGAEPGKNTPASARQLLIETDVDTALAKAAKANLPVLIIIMHPEMPGCRQFEKGVLSEQSVRTYLAANFVVAQIDVRSPLAAMFHERLGLGGLPAFVLTNADKSVKGYTYGAPSDGSAFIGEMKELLLGFGMKTPTSRTRSVCKNGSFLQGCKYMNQGELEKAIQCFDDAIKAEPNSWDVYLNRGSLYCKLKRYKEAIADMDACLKLNAKCTAAYINKGNILDETNDQNGAILEYGKAIKLDPEEPEAYFNRAIALAKVKNFASAKADFARAAVLYKRNRNERFALEAQSRLQKLTEAGH